MQRLKNYIFISIFLSGIAYSYFTATGLFAFRALSFAGLSFFYLFISMNFSLRIKELNKDFFSVNPISIYLLVVFIILIFSLTRTKIDYITLFFHPYAFPAFFLAVVALFVNKNSISFLSLVSSYMTKLIPLFTIIDLIIFKHPIMLVAGYSFLLFDFLTTTSTKRKLFIVLLLLAAINFFRLYDYRSGIIVITIFLLAFLSSRIFKLVRSKMLKFTFLVASFTLVYFLFFYFAEMFEYLTSSIKAETLSKTDSRSFLFIELFSDLKRADYAMGRGYLGTYYSPYFKEWLGDGGDSSQRFSVEIGFLQIILKGGLLLLITTILLFIKSIYFGIINYKPNSFKFLIAAWLLIEFAMLSVENFPSFGVHFFFIWILIGILNKPKRKFTPAFA
ncbi:hypothetical protein [Flavobacterium myungsuense]|uniref:O-antigen ligase domain-containing protein n=1 Tax=Flavobacterium myungsuense TaxID=651823 RepID=A0ABW3IZN3_9FLAO